MSGPGSMRGLVHPACLVELAVQQERVVEGEHLHADAHRVLRHGSVGERIGVDLEHRRAVDLVTPRLRDHGTWTGQQAQRHRVAGDPGALTTFHPSGIATVISPVSSVTT